MLVIEMVPIALPGDVGANVTPNEELDPGVIVIGMLGPLML